MQGFTLIKGRVNKEVLNYKNSEYLIESLEYNDLFIQRKIVKKFLEDKIFKQNQEYLIVIEGVIFNKLELVKKYRKNNFFEIIIEMYKKKGEKFFHEFRGSFSGVFLDKKINRLYIFTDHLGTKRINYFYKNNLLIVSSSLFELTDVLWENKINYSLNKLAVYTFFTYGTMLEDYSLVKEIKRLRAGKYLKIENKNIELIEYYKLEKKRLKEKTIDQTVDKIDKLFNNAIKRMLRKNEEYNYENWAPLSAGRDSRMTNFILNNYCNKIINITYSQNDSYDEIIPKKIASDLKHEWIYKALDNGLSYLELEKAIEISEGYVYCTALCQLFYVFKNIKVDKIGLIHTGMFGECLAGVECDMEKLPYKSNLFKDKFEILYSKYIKEIYQDSEIRNYYNGSFICEHFGSPMFFQKFTESYSPFYDLEFLEYTVSIDKKYRKFHKIYDLWIKKKYPLARKYLANGCKISEKNLLIKGKKISIGNLKKFIIKKMKLNSKFNMNPIEKWFKENENIEKYFNNLFIQNIDNIKINEEIYMDSKKLYLEGNILEKEFVLTFLLTYKKIFNKI